MADHPICSCTTFQLLLPPRRVSLALKSVSPSPQIPPQNHLYKISASPPGEQICNRAFFLKSEEITALLNPIGNDPIKKREGELMGHDRWVADARGIEEFVLK